MKLGPKLCFGLTLLAAVAGVCPRAFAAEHVTLRNGFELDCARRETSGDRVRLYLMPSARAAVANAAGVGPVAADEANYIEVAASAVLRVESIPDPPPAAVPSVAALVSAGSPAHAAMTVLSPGEMRQMLACAGAVHNIDADLLASVVQAESGGNVRAVSWAGARGLMQLMPATASVLGVNDSFVPEENIGGGATYLDSLLTRYGDNIALALAAYNAGPAAVDRYHGIPPYAETRAYVARVIREFNRRKRAAQSNLLATVK
jgi:soluble lytic murein transglycosylase-like protein